MYLDFFFKKKVGLNESGGRKSPNQNLPKHWVKKKKKKAIDFNPKFAYWSARKRIATFEPHSILANIFGNDIL